MNKVLSGLRELGRSTFALTSGERKALCLVLALALLGLAVKAWHARSADRTPHPAPRPLTGARG